jgi:hypothetical protein
LQNFSAETLLNLTSAFVDGSAHTARNDYRGKLASR